MNSNQLGEAIVLKSYDLLKTSLPTIERLPRTYKFTFGERLYHLLTDFMEQCIEAQYTPVKKKLPMLRKLNITLTKLRYYFRLGHEMGFYSAGHLLVISEKIDEIGRRIGTWIKVSSGG